MITGVDLVAEMIRIAGGAPLSIRQQDVSISGHALECRINAEDAAKSFMPSPGVVSGLRVPEGDGVRFDTMLYEGYAVPPFYDSLIGKLIVHAATREAAIDAMARALDGLTVEGIATTIPLHKALARDGEVASGRVHTRWLEPWLEANPLDAAKA